MCHFTLDPHTLIGLACIGVSSSKGLEPKAHVYLIQYQEET